jgi:hypothetical protein
MRLPQAYDALCERLKEISALEGISGLLDWDEMVGGWELGAGSRETFGGEV